MSIFYGKYFEKYIIYIENYKLLCYPFKLCRVCCIQYGTDKKIKDDERKGKYIMLLTDVAKVAEAAKNKAELCNNHFGKYFMRAVMAGFYIVVATILSNVSAAVLYSTYPQFGKLLGAFLFSLAIVLVVFLNGELFTGNNFVMAVGVYNKTVSVKDMVKVWVVSYVGNFVGAFLLSAMFVYSKASHAIMVDYYNSFIYSKISAGVPELLLRGILCNFLVCMAVLVGTKLKSESGKLIIMFCIIMSFVVAGFEHCIANMSTFSIGYMLLGNIGTVAVIKSMIVVTIGNILGGAVLLGVPVHVMKAEH